MRMSSNEIEGSDEMNEVYLNENGCLFINGHEIKEVKSVTVKTEWQGTYITVEFAGSYMNDFKNQKAHCLELDAKRVADFVQNQQKANHD